MADGLRVPSRLPDDRYQDDSAAADLRGPRRDVPLHQRTRPLRGVRRSTSRTGVQARKRPLRRSRPKRDWTDARAKVDQEDCCRICRCSDRKLEAAHIMGREHDEPKVKVGADGEFFTASKVLYVHPDRIVPLCGPFPEGCHGDVDHHRVNLLHYLTIEEQVQAVKDAGGIAPAWRHLAPVDHRAEMEAPATETPALST